MATLRSTTQWALDTNVLLHLVEGKENVRGAWEAAREHGIRLFISDVVLQEISHLAQTGQRSMRALAWKALSESRRKWAVEAIALNNIERSIAEVFAAACLEQGIIPHAERHDALVLAEAAVKGIPFLLSSDAHLLNANGEGLVLLCHARDLRVVSVLHPSAALKSLGG